MIEFIGPMEGDMHIGDEQCIVLCGAGKIGRRMLNYLSKIGYGEKIICFLDNSTGLHGTFVDGTRVLSFEDSMKYKDSACYVVTCLDVVGMVSRLVDNNVKTIHIVR